MFMKLFILLMCVYSVESIKCQVQVIGSNDYVGCFIDTKIRLLPHEYVLDDLSNPSYMENNLCLLYCKEQGYMYSGTEISEECHCGDDPYKYGPGDVNDYYKKTDFDCDWECRGDSEQICGGGWRLSVYATGYLPYKQHKSQYKLVSDSTILTAPANQVITSSSTIECALDCKIFDDCKVFVISIETGQCNLYNSYIVMCEGVKHVQSFQVYMMK